MSANQPSVPRSRSRRPLAEISFAAMLAWQTGLALVLGLFWEFASGALV
mgnify:CR=1 FL=1